MGVRFNARCSDTINCVLDCVFSSAASLLGLESLSLLLPPLSLPSPEPPLPPGGPHANENIRTLPSFGCSTTRTPWLPDKLQLPVIRLWACRNILYHKLTGAMAMCCSGERGSGDEFARQLSFPIR